MDASVCHWNVRVILFLVLLLLLSPFILCTPKVQDIDFDVIDGTYSKGDEYMLFVLKQYFGKNIPY